MSTTSQPDYRSSTSSIVAGGTIAFAGVMLTMVSFFGILQAIAAIAEDTVYAEGVRYTYEFDLTVWGWIHLVLGVAGLAVGIGLLTKQVWALVAGVMMAVLSALANFAFLPQYPLWSMVIIAVDVFIIWALCQEIDRKV